MKNAFKLLLPMAGLALFMAGTTHLSAQSQESSTSTETTTTTSGDMPPMAAPMPGYADFGYAADNYAAHRGYNEGYDKGVSDQSTGHSFRYKDDNSYRHPMGYNGGPLTQDAYNRVYRQAYMRGYQRGYRKAATK